MPKIAIRTDKAPQPIGPYSLATRKGQFIFVSGAVAFDRAGKVVGKGDVRAQTRQAFENVQAILEAAGASMDDVMKMTVFLVDANDYRAMNEIRAQFFAGDYPASTVVVVKELVVKDLLVEVEVTALLD